MQRVGIGSADYRGRISFLGSQAATSVHPSCPRSTLRKNDLYLERAATTPSTPGTNGRAGKAKTEGGPVRREIRFLKDEFREVANALVR